MKRYFLQLSYKGTQYVGWQIQPNGVSVQEEIQKALSTILRSEISIVGQGRTDSGVHALKSFAHFDFDGTIPITLDELAYKLNRFLSKDIAIQKIFETHSEFHARFSALSREYLYIVSTAKSPFNYENSWIHYKSPILARMQEAANLILGEHDFSTFCSHKSQLINKTCTVYKAEWTQNGETLEFKIQANRFVMNMVRSLVGTMVEIGLEKREPKDMLTLLAAKDRTKAGVNADPAGLHLINVHYPEELFLWKEKK